MRFRRLEYQDRVLAALDTYVEVLEEEKRESEEIAELLASRPHLDIAAPDFAERAWEALKAKDKLPESRRAIPFSPRTDGCGRPVPNAVLKVPTGAERPGSPYPASRGSWAVILARTLDSCCGSCRTRRSIGRR